MNEPVHRNVEIVLDSKAISLHQTHLDWLELFADQAAMLTSTVRLNGVDLVSCEEAPWASRSSIAVQSNCIEIQASYRRAGIFLRLGYEVRGRKDGRDIVTGEDAIVCEVFLEADARDRYETTLMKWAEQCSGLISARAVHTYDYDQNAVFASSATVLPSSPRLKPFPPLGDRVDVSRNCGRRYYRGTYVEALSATMLLGPRFWTATAASLDDVRQQGWMKSEDLPSGTLRIEAWPRPFSSDIGEEGERQNSLRALLFPSTHSDPILDPFFDPPQSGPQPSSAASLLDLHMGLSAKPAAVAEVIAHAKIVARDLKAYGCKANFSFDSLTDLDSYIDNTIGDIRLPTDKLNSDAVTPLILGVGGYVGETIKKRLKGIWRGSDAYPAGPLNHGIVVPKQAGSFFPIARAKARIEIGPSMSLSAYARDILQLRGVTP
jgi:hypothetical protein